MKKYFLISKLAFLGLMEYRFDFLMHAFKYGFFISLMALVWLAVNAESPLNNFSSSNIIFYFLIAAIIYSTSNFHTIYIEEDIKLGNLNKYLLKPLSPTVYYLFFQLVPSFFELVIKAVFIVPVLFLFQNTLHFQLINIIIFSLFLPVIFLFSFFSYSIVSNLAFWLQDVFSLRLTLMFIYRMLSGIMIPVMLFPLSVQRILFYSPIMHLAHSPIQILQNEYNTQTAFTSLGILCMWTLVVIFLQSIIWKYGNRVYEGSGI